MWGTQVSVVLWYSCIVHFDISNLFPKRKFFIIHSPDLISWLTQSLHLTVFMECILTNDMLLKICNQVC